MKSILYFIGWLIFLILWLSVFMYIPKVIILPIPDTNTFIGCLTDISIFFLKFLYLMVGILGAVGSFLYMCYKILADMYIKDLNK